MGWTMGQIKNYLREIKEGVDKLQADVKEIKEKIRSEQEVSQMNVQTPNQPQVESQLTTGSTIPEKTDMQVRMEKVRSARKLNTGRGGKGA